MTRKIVFAFLSVVVLPLGVYQAARLLTISNLAHAAIAASPITAELDLLSFKDSADGVSTGRQTVAIRSDGSKVEITPVPLRNAGVVRRVELPQGRWTTYVEGIHSKTTMVNSGVELAAHNARLANSDGKCLFTQSDELLGFELLPPGVKAAVVRWKGGPRRVTTWRLVASGCLPVKRVVEAVDSDGRYRSVFEYRPLYIVPGEPAAALFDDNSKSVQYEEMPPSKVARYGIVDNQECPGCFSPAWQRRDEKYERFRPR